MGSWFGSKNAKSDSSSGSDYAKNGSFFESGDVDLISENIKKEIKIAEGKFNGLKEGSTIFTPNLLEDQNKISENIKKKVDEAAGEIGSHKKSSI